jgi:hypothetical protein
LTGNTVRNIHPGWPDYLHMSLWTIKKAGLLIPPFLHATLVSYPLSFKDVVPLLRRCSILMISINLLQYRRIHA